MSYFSCPYTAAVRSTLNATNFEVELTLANVQSTISNLKDVFSPSNPLLLGSSSNRNTQDGFSHSNKRSNRQAREMILEHAMLDHTKSLSLFLNLSSFNKDLNEIDKAFDAVEQLQLIIRQRLLEVHQQAQNSMNFPIEIEVSKLVL